MTAQELVDSLNALFELDPKAAEMLVGHRVECNEALAQSDVPFVCSRNSAGTLIMGPIGFMNALVVNDSGKAAASYDDEMRLRGFVVVDGK